MIAARITPKVVWLGCALNLGAWTTLHLPWMLGLTPRFWVAESIIKLMFVSTAYLLAFLLNWEIAAEHRQVLWLHVAWLALAANAGLSVIRTVIESSLRDLIWDKNQYSSLFGLLQHMVIVPANACLLVGLLAIGWAYHRIGLGFKIKKRDHAAIVGVLGLMLAQLYVRAGLTEAQSAYPSGRWLQLTGLVLLSLSAAASIVLYRQAAQMKGGKLAIVLRCLTFYTLFRGVLVLVHAGYRTTLPEGQMPSGSISLDPWWQVMPWLVLLAAAHRSELITRAARELAQQRAARAAMASA